MPNWCSNCVVVTAAPGSHDRLDAFAAQAKGASNDPLQVLEFSSFLPIPDNLRRGNSNGWCVSHWGTKWDVDSAELRQDSVFSSPHNIVYTFSTANSAPDAWLFHVAKLYPDLKFEMYSDEPANDEYQYIAVWTDQDLMDVRELTEHAYYELVDVEFQEEYVRIQQLPYKELLEEFTKDEIWYDEAPNVLLELDVLARFKDEDLPTLVGHEWGYDHTAEEFDRRMKGEPNEES